MLSVENPPKFLCRITHPGLIELDEQGNFLPHRKDTMPVYGRTVPLVHPSELHKVVKFFYNDVWKPEEVPYFVLLIFYGEKLEQLGRHYALGTLNKHGEHFAIPNISALRASLLCEVIGKRNIHDRNAEFRFRYSGKKFPLSFPNAK